MQQSFQHRQAAWVGLVNRFKNYSRWAWHWYKLHPYRNTLVVGLLLYFLFFRGSDPRDTFRSYLSGVTFDLAYPVEELDLPAAIGSDRYFYKVKYGSLDYTYWFRATRYDGWQAVVDLEFDLLVNGPIEAKNETPVVNNSTKNERKQKIKMQLIYQHRSLDKAWSWKSLKLDDDVDFALLPSDFVNSKILESLKK